LGRGVATFALGDQDGRFPKIMLSLPHRLKEGIERDCVTHSTKILYTLYATLNLKRKNSFYCNFLGLKSVFLKNRPVFWRRLYAKNNYKSLKFHCSPVTFLVHFVPKTSLHFWNWRRNANLCISIFLKRKFSFSHFCENLFSFSRKFLNENLRK
jgi:hypothetical protein